MNEVVASMNGTLWIFAALVVGMVVIQAILYFRLALKFNKKNKLLSNDELKSAYRAGTVSVVGPAVSAMIVALSLVAMVGSAVTYMRCGVIGAPPWELLMANIAASAAGVQFNTPEFTKEVFVLCIFGMTFASAPYFINTIFTLKPLDFAMAKSQEKQSKGGKESFMPHLGSAAMMGIMGYSVIDYLKTPDSVAGFVVALLVSATILISTRKSKRKLLGDWNMAIAMMAGMAVAQIIATILA